MKIKRLFTLLLLTLCTLSFYAQNGRKMLDSAAEKLDGKSLNIVFDITTYKGLKPQYVLPAEVKVKDKKFCFDSKEMKIWFDGKSLWSLMLKSKEVNLSEPTQEELNSMLPTSFLYLYRQGVEYRLKPTTYENNPCYEIDVLPSAEADFKRLIIILDNHQNVKNIRLLNKENRWIRFSIRQIAKGKKFSRHTFEFKESDYPDCELIDLR